MPWVDTNDPTNPVAWVDGPTGGTALTAARLNQMEALLEQFSDTEAQAVAAYADTQVASLASSTNSSLGALQSTITSLQAQLSAITTVTPIVPTNAGSPVLAGSPIVGNVLTCSPGTWTGVTGLTSPYGYQWQRSTSVASGFTNVTGNGATSANYTLQPADAGYYFRCGVTATNTVGVSSVVYSNVSASVASSVTTSALHVLTASGTSQLLQANGTPFLAAGVTVWGQLSDTGGTGTSNTDGGEFPGGFGTVAYSNMAETISFWQSKNVNLIRYRLVASYYNSLSSTGQATYISQLTAWANAVTAAGMVFMPCMWDGTDGSYAGVNLTTNYTQLLPLITAMLASGALGTSNPLIIHEPVNEPNNLTSQGAGSTQEWQAWQTIMTWVVQKYRAAGYTGVLAIDPPDYANSGTGTEGYSDTYYSAIESADATALGSSQHQIVFSKHDYANEYTSMTWSLSAWQAAVGGSQTKHVIFETELGYENGATSTESSAWNVAAVQAMAAMQASMANFCGMSAFLAAWIDDNSLTTLGTFTTLSSWGQTYVNDYLSPSSSSGTAPALSQDTNGNYLLPTISGTTQQGSALTTSTGTWTGAPTGYTYQWYRVVSGSNQAISGATASTYTLASADVGNVVFVGVGATNGAGTTYGYSNSTVAITTTGASAPVNSAAPTISGTAQVPNTLTASAGTWTGSPTYAYQWKLNGTAISGATAATYTLISGDVGDTLTVTVTATNTGGSASATSTATATVTAASGTAPASSAIPTISGTTTQGSTLTATTGTWTGSPTPTYTYQWYQVVSGSNQAISGATSSTLTLSSTEVGTGVFVGVKATNTSGSAYSYSTTTAAVIASGGGSGGTATAVYFPSTDPFNVPITNGTLDSASATHSSALAGAANSAATMSTANDYGYPIYQATTSDPYVTLTGTAGYDSTSYSFYWPTRATANTGVDGHMVILQPDGVTAIDIYQGSGSGSSGKAAGISQYNRSTTSSGSSILPGAHCFGSRAAGISLLGGTLLASEYAAALAGTPIPHALAFACTVNSSGTRSPATHNDGKTSGGLLEGMRFRLNPSYNISALSAAVKPIAACLQTYGAIDVDSGSGGLEFFAESTATVSSVPTGYTTINSGLSGIDWSQLQLLASSTSP